MSTQKCSNNYYMSQLEKLANNPIELDQEIASVQKCLRAEPQRRVEIYRGVARELKRPDQTAARSRLLIAEAKAMKATRTYTIDAIKERLICAQFEYVKLNLFSPRREHLARTVEHLARAWNIQLEAVT